MFEQYDIFIVSLLILVVVLFNNVKNGGENRARQRLFRSLIACDMMILLISAALMVLDNSENVVAAFIMAMQSAFLFLNVLFCEIWAFFCTYRSGHRIRKRGFIVLSVPLFVVTMSLVLTLYNTAANILEWKPLLLTLGAAMLFYIGYSIILIWRGKKNMEKREYYLYLLGPIVIAGVGVAKSFFALSGSVVWPAVAVGLLVLQLFALDEKMNLDHLTGLYNRKYLDAYIEDMLSEYQNIQGENRGFAALMLDIDNFKNINDTFGHVQGDKVLISAAKLLKKSLRRGDFVARYGGDEFMIVLDRCAQQTPEQIIRRLQQNVSQYNTECKQPYELSFSIGCKRFTNVCGLDVKDIFKTIDELMYVHKQNKAAATSKFIKINK